MMPAASRIHIGERIIMIIIERPEARS